MKTKTLKKNKVNVVTMGCSKNLYDSEVMMAQLKANKFEVEHESKVNDASIVIINTCGFIESAKEESINTILDFVDAKKEGLVEKVYVSGCLSERYKDQLEDEIPDVDAYFGSKELPNIKQDGDNFLLKVDSSELGYDIVDGSSEIVAYGKFNV